MTEQEKLGIMADVTIYIENTRMIYDNVIMPVCDSLARKKFKGSYDDNKAKKAWYNVVNRGLQCYYKDVYQEYYADKYGNISAWYNLLTPFRRRQIADELQAFYTGEVDFLTNRLIKEHEKPFFVGVVVSSAYLRSDVNGNSIYEVTIKCNDEKIFSGESKDTHCFHNWIDGKKVKVFYHYTPKRKKLKLDEFQLL